MATIHSNFPFRTSPAELVIPAGSEDAEGTINYWVHPDTYSERYTAGGGCTAAVELSIDTSSAPLFAKYALGYSYRSIPAGNPILRRRLPLVLPYNDKLFLTDLALVKPGEAASGAGTTGEPPVGWPKFNWQRYRATFEDRPYEVVDDTAMPSEGDAGRELVRYVKRVHKPTFRERVVPGWSTTTTDNQTISQTAFIIDRVVDWGFTWFQVPFAGYPKDTIAALAGKVNSVLFDDEAGFGIKAAEETLLFRGVANEVEPYRARNGLLCVDVTYLFSHRATGWNNYVKPDGSVVGWRYRTATGTPTNKPYLSGDLHLLFKPTV